MKSAHSWTGRNNKKKLESIIVWIIMMKKRYRSRREGEFVCPTSLPPGGYGIIASVILILLQVI